MGYGTYGYKSEIIDLSISGNYHCPYWINPIDTYGSTGGLLGTTPIICGGLAFECHTITKRESKPIATTTTTFKRIFAASVMINDEVLWVSGGEDYTWLVWDLLSSSEFIQLDGITPGPDLTMGLKNHAMININDSRTMVIGGYSKVGVHTFSSYKKHSKIPTSGVS